MYIHMYKVIHGPLIYINRICGCKKKNENQIFVFYLKNKITKTTLGMVEHAKENGAGSDTLFSY